MLTLEEFVKSVLAIVHVTDPRDSTEKQAFFALMQTQNLVILIIIEYIIQTCLHIASKRWPGSRPPVPRYMLNDTFVGILSSILELLCLSSFSISSDEYNWWSYRLCTLPDNSWITFIIAMLAYELCYYGMHRAMHEVRIIWFVHRVHHDAQDMHFAMGARRHVLTSAFVWFDYIPMALLGIPSKYTLLHGALNNAWQIWVHTKFVPKQHWIIEYLFNTASHHRVHHGRNPYCIDKNYGGFLIIFDRIFGTFQEEDENEPVLYGVTKPLKTANPLVVQVYPFIELVEDIVKCPWYYTPLLLLSGPGWSHKEPLNRLGNKSDIPGVPNLKEDPDALYRERFEPELNIVVKMYLFINLCFLCVVFLDMTAVIDYRAGVYRGFFFYYLLGSGSLGLLWDDISAGHWTEVVRNAVTFCLLDQFGTNSMLVKVLMGWSVLSIPFNLACGMDLAGRLGIENVFSMVGLRSAQYSSVEIPKVEVELGETGSLL